MTDHHQGPYHVFPEDAAARKTYPVYSGCLKYFPDALAAVAHVSYLGNEQHHPGTPLHWDRSKSKDEADALIRHLIEGEYDKVAWRALALLQKHIEGGRDHDRYAPDTPHFPKQPDRTKHASPQE